MTSITIADALGDLYPDLLWGIRNSDYNALEWLDTEVPKPTLEALEQRRDELIAAQPLKDLRKKRDDLLSKTDKFAIPDWPHPTEEVKQAWLDYRQALRDLPANTTDPENPVWPQAPTS